MSYILDALKKADAEREREGVPSLHTQHGHAVDTHERPTRPALGAAGSLPWAVGGVAAGLVVLVGGWWLRSAPEPAAPPPMAAAPVAVAQPAHMVPVAAAPTTTPTTTPLAPPSATTPATPAPRLAPRGTPSTSALRVDPSLRETPRRVVPVAELPEEVRRELPALSIGGAMHSDVPANRMLVLNGSVFHEGDQPAPGLVLEEIKLKSAVFRFKEHRYSVAY